MTPDEFRSHKRHIMKLLWKKGDPAPICNVQPGVLKEREALVATREFAARAENSGCTLLRGYRMIVMLDVEEVYSFAARSEAAVRLKDGRVISFAAHRNRTCNNPFIFVPSSRVHTELDDERFYSGFYYTCTVVGGSVVALNIIEMLKTGLSLFERRMFCTSPEEATSVPSTEVRYYPFFSEFLSSSEGRILGDNKSMNDVCVCFGMPYKIVEFSMNKPPPQSYTYTIAVNESIAESIIANEKDGWIVEKDVWLPSVETMQRALVTLLEESALPLELAKPVIFDIYSRLAKEYVERSVCVGERLINEGNVRQNESFF